MVPLLIFLGFLAAAVVAACCAAASFSMIVDRAVSRQGSGKPEPAPSPKPRPDVQNSRYITVLRP